MKQGPEVLVVGAGPTGLMMAGELARRGVSVRILDRGAGPSVHSKALAVQPRTLELFQKMGIVERYLPQGQRGQGVTLFVRNRPAAAFSMGDIGEVHSPYPFIFFISQAETEALLEGELNRLGVRVERETRLETLRQEEGGVTAEITGPTGARETLRVPYLVGCDGAHSTVRHELGLEFPGGTYAQEFLLADARVRWDLPSDRLMVFLGKKGVMAHFPMPGKYSRLVIATDSRNPRHSGPDREDVPLAEVEALARTYRSPLSLEDGIWVSRFRLHHRAVRRYSVGRVFLCGDAAHIHSPAGGQGMNTGIQDAQNLAWKLALVLKRGAPAELLRTYHEERWPVGQFLLKRTDRFFTLAASANPLIVIPRNFLAPRVARFLFRARKRRTLLFRFISQLAIHYERSPLAREGEPALPSGPRAGDRAPDAPLANPDPASTLFARMADARFHLLAFLSPASEESWRLLEKSLSPIAELQLHPLRGEREAFTRYGISGEGLYLIRPDGYIAYRSGRLEAQPVRELLSRHYGLGH